MTENNFPRYMWPNMKECPDNEETGHGFWIPCAPDTERTCPKCERSKDGASVVAKWRYNG